jgi:hypothetical protein
MNIRFLIVPVLAAATLTACSGEVTSTRPCLDVPTNTAKLVMNMGHPNFDAYGTRSAKAVKDPKGGFIIAVAFSVPGDQVAVFQLPSLEPGTPVLAVDESAQAFTQWPHAGRTDAGLASDAVGCLGKP